MKINNRIKIICPHCGATSEIKKTRLKNFNYCPYCGIRVNPFSRLKYRGIWFLNHILYKMVHLMDKSDCLFHFHNL